MALPDCQAGTKVALFLNHRCNLRCRYCYNGAPFDRPMSRGTARRAVDFAFDFAGEQPGEGFLHLSFFGGEPLLEIDRIEQVVAHARAEAERRRRPLRFSLSTNATVLDDRRLRLLAAPDFHAQVSLDGCERAQDATRRFASGRSTYRRASENLARLIAAGVDAHVVAIVDPANVAYLAESFDALRALGPRRIYFVPNLLADWDEAAWRVLDAALDALAEAWAASLRAGAALRLDPFDGKVGAHLIRGTAPAARCAFGERELAISPRGRVYPCDRVVKDDRDDALLLGTLDTGLDEDRRRSLAAARRHIEPECERCELADRCVRGCGCTNYEQTGHPGRVPPSLCRWERAVIARADRVASALFTERDASFLRRFYASLLPRPAGDAAAR